MKLGELNPKVQSVLIYGPPGTGKTCFVLTLGERLHFLDLEAGVSSGAFLADRFTPERHKVDVKQFSDPDLKSPRMLDEVKNYILEVQRRIRKGDFPFEAICIDSLSAVATSALRTTMLRAGKAENVNPAIQDWGAAILEVQNVAFMLRNLPILSILIAHTQLVEIGSEKNKRTVPRLGVYGRNLPDLIMGPFDEVWFAEARDAPGGKTRFCLRTISTADVIARTRFQLPDPTDMTQGLPEILSTLNREKTP